MVAPVALLQSIEKCIRRPNHIERILEKDTLKGISREVIKITMSI